MIKFYRVFALVFPLVFLCLEGLSPFLSLYECYVQAVIAHCTVTCPYTATFSYCRPRAEAMELEELYRRYCDRLKHSLFLNSLLIAAVGCVVSLVAICAFSSTVSM
jgi:hypothetical protein